MKKILKTAGIIVAILLLAFGIFLIYATINDYAPKEKTILFQNEKADALSDTSTIAIITWNIGYAGLSDDMSFFYEGGEKVQTTKDITVENLNKIQKFIASQSDVDFFLIQEIDKNSKRSYNINQLEIIGKVFPKYTSIFANNYKVSFVPIPIYDPIGKINSGMMTMSRNCPAKSTRHSFPGNFKWPKSVFMLDRCFTVNRHPLENDKELLIINTHNSAYDKGNLKKRQMEYLKKFLLKEYKKGNYVIIGGDWNQTPPKYYPKDKKAQASNYKAPPSISENYLPKGWSYIYDKSNPSNRILDMKYKKGKTTTTLVDYFIISPNIQSLNIKTIDLNFENSDHNPVKITVKLKTDKKQHS